MPQLIRKLNTARQLSPGEWLILIKSWGLMLYIRLKMDYTPFSSWKHWLTSQPVSEQFVLTTQQKQYLLRLRRLINLASRYHPLQANCLPKSLAMKWMLEKQAVPCKLKIGLNIENNQVKGHAWLVIHDMVINDTKNVASRYPIEQNISTAPPKI